MSTYLIVFLSCFKAFCSSVNVQESRLQTFADDNLTLQFVQVLWRHGDRSALADLYPIFESDWKFGGGGFGELTPDGMEQMFELGGKLREKYVTEMEFLSPQFRNNEMHVRSTDKNRTIISAMSLLYGFYPPGNWNQQGVDYPLTSGWQNGLAFIPIHVDSESDRVTNPIADCPRNVALQSSLTDVPEYYNHRMKWANFTAFVQNTYNLSASSPEFQFFSDTIRCQRIHFNATLYEKLSFYNEEFYNNTQLEVSGYKRMTEGVFEQPAIVNGIDYAKELRTLHGGPIFNELFDRAQQTLECSQTKCTSSISNLKLYAYSAHDMTLYSILAILGIPNVTATIDSWPYYSSCISLEFYTSSSSQDTFFNILYRQGPNEPLNSVTHLIEGCNNRPMCSMEVFKNLAQLYKPQPNIQTLCAKPLKSSSSSRSGILHLLYLLLLLAIKHSLVH